MRLLFDQNLSRKLVASLAELFPDSEHVQTAGLERASDEDVRDFARRQGLVIVTKDSDFVDLGLLLGFPPSVVWIRTGNASTPAIEGMLRDHEAAIRILADPQTHGVVELAETGFRSGK